MRSCLVVVPSPATREDSRYTGRFVRSPRGERSLKYCTAPIASAMATNTIATVLVSVPRGTNHQAQAGIAATSSHDPGVEPCARIVTPLRCSITSRAIVRQMTATSPASPIRGVPLQPERPAAANTKIRPNSISTSSRRTSALALTCDSDSVIVIAPRGRHPTYCPIHQFGVSYPCGATWSCSSFLSGVSYVHTLSVCFGNVARYDR